MHVHVTNSINSGARSDRVPPADATATAASGVNVDTRYTASAADLLLGKPSDATLDIASHLGLSSAPPLHTSRVHTSCVHTSYVHTSCVHTSYVHTSYAEYTSRIHTECPCVYNTPHLVTSSVHTASLPLFTGEELASRMCNGVQAIVDECEAQVP
jgi:hypothetical protein